MARLRALGSRLQQLPPRIATFSNGDRGRAEASPWRSWYNTARWRALRLRVFERDLFTCQWPGCGRVEPNTSLLVADHVQMHRGDERLFWDFDNLQTLCKPCHDGPKQRAEQRSAVI
ncbi:HNH endonuclease [Sphingomonas leidyi]|uniref:HNH endonuclease n=1 Tax=Sphingomonas leidyi TaxID=68569 RepID=UPI0036D24FEC